MFTLQALALDETPSEDIIRIQCSGDVIKKNKSNQVASDVFTFTIKDGKLYGREGELIKNAIITDEEIKGKTKYYNSLAWENVRFQINRYSGAFTYFTIYRTLNKEKQVKNNGQCKKKLKTNRCFKKFSFIVLYKPQERLF